MFIGTNSKRRPISSSTLPLNGFSGSEFGEQPKLINTTDLKNLRTVEWKL